MNWFVLSAVAAAGAAGVMLLTLSHQVQELRSEADQMRKHADAMVLDLDVVRSDVFKIQQDLIALRSGLNDAQSRGEQHDQDLKRITPVVSELIQDKLVVDKQRKPV